MTKIKAIKDETHKRRNRVPISCTICRRRKVKCTKERPVCKGCEKTGVGHLCHYIEPSWAQSTTSTGESNVCDDNSPEEQNLLIGRLKERIKSLEMELSTCNSNGSSPTLTQQSSFPLSTSASSCSFSSSSDEYEVLSLGKKFDMLHVKATTTVHLGPTSWLAIMKGDPYLRVLWAHIFKMRKQVEDFKFMMRQRQLASQGISVTRGKCPVSHQAATIPDPITASMCPVVHSHSKTASAVADSTCPLMIDGNSYLPGPQKDPKKHQLDGEVKFLQKSTSSPNKRAKTTAASKEENINIHELFKDDKLKALELLLPSRQVFWLLIERFFEILYVYMPYLDETGFKEEIRVIFGTDPGPDGDGNTYKIKLKVRTPVDYALIGTTCILLRLSWLTLPKNSCNSHLGKNTTTKTYVAEDMSKIRLLELPSNEISLELVRCVKQYMNNNNDNDQLIKKSNLKVVQFAMFLKLFDQYSPEEKDSADGSDSQVFFGMIVHMAVRIGLYRDPDNFENFTVESQRHLWRKLWFGLVSLDVEQSINLGCPRALESYLEFSDTKLFPQEEEEFSSDLRELTVIKLIKTQYQVDLLLGKAMRVLLNVNKPARKYQIDQLIEELTRHTQTTGANLPQLGTILVNRAKQEPLFASATRAVQFKLTSQINMLIYLLNYILFVHFEPLGTQDIVFYKLAKTHAQRALDAALEGYRNCTLFFDCNLDYFGPGADLMISPLVLLIGHRSVQFMVSLILRSRCGPYMRPAVASDKTEVKREEEEEVDDDTDKEKMFGLNKVNNRNYDLQKVEIRDEQEPAAAATTNFYNTDVDSGETLAKILLKHMENFHKLTDKLGGKYPYSWRMSKAVGFFVTLLRKPVNIVKAIVKTDNVKSVENDTGFASNVLNSVPLVLHSDEVGMDLSKSKSKSKSKEEVFEDALEDQDQAQDKKAEPPASNDLLRGIPDFIVPNSQFLFDFNEVSLDQSINEIFNNNNNSSDPSNLNNSNNQLNNFDFNFDPMQGTTVSDFTNDLLFGNLMTQPGTNTTTTSFNGESFDPIINNLMTADGSVSGFNSGDDDGFNAFSGLFN